MIRWLQRQPKYFLKYISNSHRLFLSYSLGIETTNTFLLQNHTRFHTETAQKNKPFRAAYIYLYIAYGYLWVSQEYLQGSVNNPAKYQKTCYFLYPHLYKAKPITCFGKVIGFWSWKPLSGFKIFNLRPWTGGAFRPAIMRFPPG